MPAALKKIIINTLMLLSCYFFSAHSLSIPFTLNGLASYSELNQDYYIAALYLPQRESQPQNILNDIQIRQMKLLVTTQRWSPRLWTKQWQNNIAINNPKAHEKLQHDLNRFSSLLNDDLVAGDVININYQPQSGTHVLINQQLLLSTTNIELFNALLSTWIGKLPPSRDFKNRILKLANDQRTQVDLQQLYTNVVPKSRKKDIQAWRYSPAQMVQIQKKEAQNTQALINIKERLAARKIAKIEKEKRDKQLAQQKKARDSWLKKQQAAQAITLKKEKKKRIELSKVQREKEKQLEDNYYKSLYRWKLSSAIRNNIHYPIWAREFNQEGTVEAVISIDEKGNIINSQFNAEEVSSFLISEVKKSIDQVSTEMIPPKSLPHEKWQFSVSHNFSFSSKKQTVLEQPNKPRHL